jgi:hypothetical protein
MDLTIFTLVSVSSVSELIGSTDTAVVAATVGVIVGAKLLAWAWRASSSAWSRT